MNTPPLLIVGGFLAAGLVGGATATLLAPGQPAPDPAGDSLSLTPDATPETRQLADLVETVAALTDRLAMLEARPTGSSRVPAGDLPDAALDAEALEAAVASALDSSSEGAAMRLMVSQALEDIRAQEEVERDIERDQRDQQRLQAQVDRLTEQLGLYPDQVTAVLDLYAAQDAKRDELRDSLRDGGGGITDVRQAFRDLNDETKAGMEGILTPEQFTTYTEQNLGGGGFGGGFGGGGRRGGGFGG